MGGRERACRGVRAARTICQWQIDRPERTARKRGAAWQARPDLSTDKSGKKTLQLHPLVPPQVLHFMHVPLRTSV